MENIARINPPVHQHWFGKFINSVIAKRFGKPFPALALLGHNPPYTFAYAVMANVLAQGKTQLPENIKLLARQLVSETNACGFCADLGKRIGQDVGLSPEKLQYVLDYKNRPDYTASERAALQFSEEATHTGVQVQQKTFDELKKYFSEREILELTVAVALENFYNRLNAPLGVGSQGFCAIETKS